MSEFLPLIMITLAAGMYARRSQTLRSNNAAPAVRQELFVWAAFAVLALATSPPLHALSEQMLTAHMIQHILLTDIAPILLAIGLTGPLLRPLLAQASLRRVRFVGHPLVAFPIWATVLVVWHLPVMYDAAVTHETLHALEHATFVLAGLALWAAVFETLPGPSWFTTWCKLGYVIAIGAIEMSLGNVLFWSGSSIYPHYAGAYGLNAYEDQQLAGATMMTEGTLVVGAVLCMLFLRALHESERQQVMLEHGIRPHTARRATRYRRDPKPQKSR